MATQITLDIPDRKIRYMREFFGVPGTFTDEEMARILAWDLIERYFDPVYWSWKDIRDMGLSK
jgi:hypothetical protein